MISFTIAGDPVAKGRPKASTRGGFVKMYTPKKTAVYEKLVADVASVAMGSKQALKEAVYVSINFYLPIPKSKPKKWQEGAICGAIVPTVKPDIDNLAKAILDGINTIVYDDDKQIAQLTVSKRYALNPRVEVNVRELFSS